MTKYFHKVFKICPLGDDYQQRIAELVALLDGDFDSEDYFDKDGKQLYWKPSDL